MRLSKFTPWALLAGLYFVPVQAVAAPAYACSVAEIFECTAVAGCQRVSAAQANLPPFVTLNVKEKALFSGLFGGQGLFSPGDVYEDPTVLILHGTARPADLDRGRGQGYRGYVDVDLPAGQDLLPIRQLHPQSIRSGQRRREAGPARLFLCPLEPGCPGVPCSFEIGG